MHDRHRRGRKPTVGSQQSPISGTGTASQNKTFHSYHQNQQASASARTMDRSTICTDTAASACTGTRGTYTAPQIPFTLPTFTRTSACTIASNIDIASASVNSRIRKPRGRNTNTTITRSTRHKLCFQWIVRACLHLKNIPIVSCILIICIGIFCLLHLVSVSFAKDHYPYSNVKSLPIPMPSIPFATKTTVASTISHSSMHVTKGGILKIPPTAAKSTIIDEDNKADTTSNALIRKPNQIQKPKYNETLPKKKSNMNTSKTDNSEQSSIPNRIPKPSQITPESEFDDIPISIVHKQNAGNPFSLTIHFENDIVSSRIDTHTRSQSQGWEHSKLQQLTEIYTSYSQQHNIPLEDLTFVDIGAHVGWFAFNMAALGVQVLAFEPMPQNVALIHMSLAMRNNVQSGISGRIHLYPFGLGNHNMNQSENEGGNRNGNGNDNKERCVVYSHEENVGDGHVKCQSVHTLTNDLVKSTNPNEYEREREHEQNEAFEIPAGYTIRGSIPVHRLDDVIDVHEEGLHIVAIKMDTEGYEGNIVEGGMQLLLHGKVDAILTEFVEDWIVSKGGDPEDCMRKLGGAGYRVMKQTSLHSRNYWAEEEMIERAKNRGFHGDLTLYSKNLFE